MAVLVDTHRVLYKGQTWAVFLTKPTGAPWVTMESAIGLAMAEAAMAAMGGKRAA